eukprot:1157012-Pelagomonas_calceolata.AAC.6
MSTNLLRGHQQNIPIPEALQRGIWGHSEAIQDEQQSTRAELEAALELQVTQHGGGEAEGAADAWSFFEGGVRGAWMHR